MTTWINGTTALNANNMNSIEDRISENRSLINNILGGMRFIGYANNNNFPPVSPSKGDVYQAEEVIVLPNSNEACKIGDLIVYVEGSNPWNRIPSGDEFNGTVTRVIAGNGISTGSGPIITEGTVSVNDAYIKNVIASDLGIQSYDNHILSSVAKTGSYNDLTDKPSGASRPFFEVINDSNPEPGGGFTTALVSYYGVKTALESKANLNHQHSISNIETDNVSHTPFGDLLPKQNGSYVDIASSNHQHGRLDRNGYVLTSESGGQTVPGTGFVITDSSGKLSWSAKVSSNDISGTTIGGPVAQGGIDIAQLKSDVESIQSNMPDSNKQAATFDHVHSIFTTSSNGFVPAPGNNSGDKVLYGDGTWKEQNFLTDETNEFIKYTTTNADIEVPNNSLKIIVLDSELGENETYQENVLYLIKG